MRMRILAYLCLFFSGMLLYSVIEAERTGVATALRSKVEIQTVRRVDNPELFRHFMQLKWSYCIAVALPGLAILALFRRQDRLDPSSPNFEGKASLAQLDEMLTSELDKCHRPLR